MPPEQAIDITHLRYVLYARKSTEDENRQVRSIPDQVKECKKLASDLGLHIVDVVRETKSAKKPGQRPLFAQMVRDIEAKKYDSILCWHPDRLCRNMLEGGYIINMLDEGTLKDIRFNSHQFSNDANGKMLLGMLFVFSKQYSDDLSAKVKRGVDNNLIEGKSSGTPKFGYDRNEQSGLYERNQFFDLIKEAWQRRAQGESLEAVVKFLVDNGYSRATKNSRRPRNIKPTVNALAKMYHDPFYHGVLVQADQTIDLRTLNNFVPMVEDDLFNQVQLLNQGRTKDKFTAKRATFYPLRGFVYCAVCGYSKYMAVGKSKSEGGGHFLYYRCENQSCTRKPRSLRARQIFNSIYDYLSRLELTDEAYTRYSRRIDNMTGNKIIEIKQEILSKRGAASQLKHDIKERSLKIGLADKDSPIYKANAELISNETIQLAQLENDATKLEGKISNPSRIKLSKEEFLNVIRTASDKMKAGSAVEKDALCRILFLNVHVDNEKVVNYIWNEPFASLAKVAELSSGGDERT